MIACPAIEPPRKRKRPGAHRRQALDLTLRQAREKGGQMAALYQGHRDLREHLERVKIADEEQRKAGERERAEAQARAPRSSLPSCATCSRA